MWEEGTAFLIQNQQKTKGIIYLAAPKGRFYRKVGLVA
jgi:hypothetical protein